MNEKIGIINEKVIFDKNNFYFLIHFSFFKNKSQYTTIKNVYFGKNTLLKTQEMRKFLLLRYKYLLKIQAKKEEFKIIEKLLYNYFFIKKNKKIKK
jgi:tRNA A22 N-methylase